jgi:hypothetical protein
MEEELTMFLIWQASRRQDREDQKKFREDVLLYPRLLVFACMRKKSPLFHLVHSAGVYPKIPGADPEWQGKSISFLRDRSKYANPQMVELRKTMAWAWDDVMLPTDLLPMEDFYSCPGNHLKFRAPGNSSPRRHRACPQMLALPAQYFKFYATQQ